MPIHAIFDLLATMSALGIAVSVHSWRLGAVTERTVSRVGRGYFLALVAGAVIGGYGLGTLNLHLSGIPGVGRSILGALAGATAAVESYKAAKGIRGSTGVIFVAAFSTSVAVGRVGCFLSGISDRTHGTPTLLPWGHDFGDGILRHPVQLYEAATMTALLVWFLAALRRRSPRALSQGFYLMVAVYAGQRFVWEFLKPYATLLGPFNLFHFVCFGLLVYAIIMITRTPHERT